MRMNTACIATPRHGLAHPPGAGRGAGVRPRTALALAVVAAVALLAGCAAGPDFQRPQAPTVASRLHSVQPRPSA